MRLNDPEHPNYLSNFEYLVEATHTEQLYLWQQWAKEAEYLNLRSPKRVSWREDERGPMFTIGHLGKRPVNVWLLGATIGGRRVAFYESVSEVVDWAMIEKWRKKTFPHLFTGSGCSRHCNAANFRQVVSFVNA